MAEATQGAKKKTVDWEAVCLRYRTGTESLRSIAADHGISEAAIRQKAKREDWPRDLSARVKLATEQALLRKSTSQGTSHETEREVVAVEAEMRSNIILGHRKDAGRARAVGAKLLDELETQTDAGPSMAQLLQAIDDPDDKALARAALSKAISLGNRASVYKTMADALAKVVSIEREAFGLESGAGEPDGDRPKRVVLEFVDAPTR